MSIVICTYNRARDLEKLIEQILNQSKTLYNPDLSLKKVFELIVIDNNSKDRTSNIVSDYILKNDYYYPSIKLINEPKQGISFARNRGIEEAAAELIVFLDDDVEIEKDWLENCLKIAIKKPKKYLIGARVIPLWASDLPNWLNLNPPFEIIQSCFPAHDYGEQELSYPFELSNILDTTVVKEENPVLDKELQEKNIFQKIENIESKFKRKVQNPISACFIASKDIFEICGKFREDLGIIGDKRGACEDTEFFWRVLSSGIPIQYQPRITIKHPIPKERISKEFVLRWYELLGYTLEYMKSKGLIHLSPEENYKHNSQAKLLIKKIFLSLLYLGSFVLLDPVKSFWFQAQLAKLSGEERFCRFSLSKKL